MKILDKISNIALILGVATFLAIVIRGEIRKPYPSNSSPRSLVGSSVRLPGLNLSQSHKSLVLAISTTCHFCQESLPLYKELSSKAQGRFDLIAVLPQPLEVSRPFLEKAGIFPTKVVSANLASMGIQGTPTLLLLDAHGNVQQEWQGAHDDKGSQQLLKDLID